MNEGTSFFVIFCLFFSFGTNGFCLSSPSPNCSSHDGLRRPLKLWTGGHPPGFLTGPLESHSDLWPLRSAWQNPDHWHTQVTVVTRAENKVLCFSCTLPGLRDALPSRCALLPTGQSPDCGPNSTSHSATGLQGLVLVAPHPI